MMETNTILIQFVADNLLALTAAGVLLNGLSRVTGWRWLGAIVGIFSEAVNVIRGKSDVGVSNAGHAADADSNKK